MPRRPNKWLPDSRSLGEFLVRVGESTVERHKGSRDDIQSVREPLCFLVFQHKDCWEYPTPIEGSSRSERTVACLRNVTFCDGSGRTRVRRCAGNGGNPCRRRDHGRHPPIPPTSPQGRWRTAISSNLRKLRRHPEKRGCPADRHAVRRHQKGSGTVRKARPTLPVPSGELRHRR